MTFWQFARCVDPLKTLAPICPECGAALVPGKRLRQLLWLLLVGAVLIGVWVSVAWQRGVAIWPELVLPAGLAILGLSTAFGLLHWRYSDHVVRRQGPYPAYKLAVILAVVLWTVLVVGFVAGFVVGVFLPATE